MEAAADGIMRLVSEAQALNSRVFSLPRLLILASLEGLGADGATYRELKAGLELNDGVLYANLEALKGMGYLRCLTVSIENKQLESYAITKEGFEEWKRVKEWLCKFLGCGGGKK